jgi:hypothetical protein
MLYKGPKLAHISGDTVPVRVINFILIRRNVFCFLSGDFLGVRLMGLQQLLQPHPPSGKLAVMEDDSYPRNFIYDPCNKEINAVG